MTASSSTNDVTLDSVLMSNVSEAIINKELAKQHQLECAREGVSNAIISKTLQHYMRCQMERPPNFFFFFRTPGTLNSKDNQNQSNNSETVVEFLEGKIMVSKVRLRDIRLNSLASIPTPAAKEQKIIEVL